MSGDVRAGSAGQLTGGLSRIFLDGGVVPVSGMGGVLGRAVDQGLPRTGMFVDRSDGSGPFIRGLGRRLSGSGSLGF